MPKPPVHCIFCGLNKPGNREHVVQDALGGVDVLTDVCGDCNQLLAVNDRVLTVESALSIFVRRELSGVGPNSWDVDRTSDGLLLEARTTPGTDSMTLVPQLIFDGDERLIYCDSDDINVLGQAEVVDRFYTRLRSPTVIFGCTARMPANATTRARTCSSSARSSVSGAVTGFQHASAATRASRTSAPTRSCSISGI